MSSKPIFIGGVGRSGTTLLQRVIGQHAEIFALPFESRFIIDLDGLLDLIYHLTDGWTPANLDLALERFRRLMLVDLCSGYRQPYRGFRFKRYFSEPFYSDAVNNFITELAPIKYRGRTALRRGYGPRTLYQGPPWSKKAAFAAGARLIDTLFSRVMERDGKKMWAEKTPHNILHLPQLQSLFPDARFVHITRDPRDIAVSLMGQRWGPSEAPKAASWIIGVMERFDHLRRAAPSIPLFEISLEALVSSPGQVLSGLAQFLELAVPFPPVELDLEAAHIGRWRRELTPAGQKEIITLLTPLILRWGYQI